MIIEDGASHNQTLDVTPNHPGSQNLQSFAQAAGSERRMARGNARHAKKVTQSVGR